MKAQRRPKTTDVDGLYLPEQISRDRQYMEKIMVQIEETRNEIRLDYMAGGERSVIKGRLTELAKSEKELMKTFELIAKRHIKLL